jgi:stage II sporulation protein AB (anti-sigma F factor)
MLDSGETLSRSYLACAESVPLARQDLTDFARDAGATGERLDKIRLATSEALTNAVLHAYEEPGGTINVSAVFVSPDELWVLVTDHGAGLRVRRQSRGLGLGLAVIAQLVDDFQILSRGTGGTELRMEFKLDPAGPRTQDRRGSLSSAVAPA